MPHDPATEPYADALDRILNGLTELLESWRADADRATYDRLKAEMADRPWDAERLGAKSDTLKACAASLETALNNPNLGRN